VNYAKTYLTGALPEIWLFALGGLFIAVTLLLPKGLAGLLPSRDRQGRGQGRGREGDPGPDGAGGAGPAGMAGATP